MKTRWYFINNSIEYLIWECIKHKDISYIFVRKVFNYEYDNKKFPYMYMMFKTFSEYIYFVLKVIYKCRLKYLDMSPNDE